MYPFLNSSTVDSHSKRRSTVSLKPSPIAHVPEETARIAKAAFPRGNRYLLLRDTFGDLFDTTDFQPLFSREGKPAEDPARLALITILQFAERLSDERAADAVRSRIDLKYLLALPLDDPGFDSSVLCEFRTRLIEGNAEQLLFERLLERFRAHKLLRERGRQRTDSTHILAAIHALNRLSCVGQTFRHALNVLATVAPEWFLAHAKPDWVERYGQRFEVESEVKLSKKAEREVLEHAIAADGLLLLTAIFSPAAPGWLRDVPAVQTLWRVWIQNFTWVEANATESRVLRFRSDEEVPSGKLFINSPFDLDARLSKKYAKYWVGYKLHLTEACDEDLPLLVTNVETTLATTQDFDTVSGIHASLNERGVLPNEHLVDMGYIGATQLVEAKREYGIDLVGPPRQDQHRQAWEGKGFATKDFRIDWEAQSVTCPAGRSSQSWTDAEDFRGRPMVKIKFSSRDCKRCVFKLDCTSAPRRTVTLHAREQFDALEAARAREGTDEFKALYAKRAGIEGSVSVAVRAFGVRRSRYRGFARTRLQHVATVSALNLVRVADHLAGRARATTRVARFERVMQQAA
jgi:transposase